MSAPSNNGTLNPQTVTGGDAGSVIIGPTTIKSDSVFENNVNIYGTLTVSGFQTDYDSLHVTNDLTVGDTLNVTGASTFVGTIRTNESATVDLDLLVSGASHLVHAVTTDGGITETAGNITATLGNISATAGSVSAGTTVTAGTGITVTTGDVNVLVGGVIAEGSITANAGDVNVTLGGVFAGGAIDAGTTVHAGTNITAAGTITATGTMGASNLSGTNTGDQTITLTGDVTGSGTGSFATTLANTAVTPAAYGTTSTWPTFTVDSKGRLTVAADATMGAIAPSSLTTTSVKTAAATAMSIAQDATQLIGWDTNGYVTVGTSGGRVGLYGVTPVVKAAAIAAPTDLATCITAINAIRVALQNLGITA